MRELLSMLNSPTDELVEMLRWRLPELLAWGDRSWATEYMDVVASVHRSERLIGQDATPLTEAAARVTCASS